MGKWLTTCWKQSEIGMYSAESRHIQSFVGVHVTREWALVRAIGHDHIHKSQRLVWLKHHAVCKLYTDRLCTCNNTSPFINAEHQNTAENFFWCKNAMLVADFGLCTLSRLHLLFDVDLYQDWLVRGGV